MEVSLKLISIMTKLGSLKPFFSSELSALMYHGSTQCLKTPWSFFILREPV